MQIVRIDYSLRAEHQELSRPCVLNKPQRVFKGVREGAEEQKRWEGSVGTDKWKACLGVFCEW